MTVGHLPLRPPFSMVLAWPPSNTPPPPQQRLSQKITQPEILASIEDTDSFYDLYVNVSNRAIDMYAKAGRRKFALKLHGSLAALDVYARHSFYVSIDYYLFPGFSSHRGRLESALTTYMSLPAHYAPHMWTSLEALMLSHALDTHIYLEKPKDSEWIHILLAYLKTYVESVGVELLMHEEDKVAYITRLVDSLKIAAKELDSGTTSCLT